MSSYYVTLNDRITGEVADEILDEVRKVDPEAYLEITYVIISQEPAAAVIISRMEKEFLI